VRRAARADLQIATGGGLEGLPTLALVAADAVSLAEPAARRPLSDFKDRPVRAVAGIGHPERFFATLRGHGLTVLETAYPDHHRFSAEDLRSWGDDTVLMTEKDAVKCQRLPHGGRLWSVPVTAVPEQGFVAALSALMRRRGIIAGTARG
jgi:tetraacyldisaccharide 4'-kinase